MDHFVVWVSHLSPGPPGIGLVTEAVEPLAAHIVCVDRESAVPTTVGEVCEEAFTGAEEYVSVGLVGLPPPDTE
jgi:hypothetical protein